MMLNHNPSSSSHIRNVGNFDSSNNYSINSDSSVNVSDLNLIFVNKPSIVVHEDTVKRCYLQYLGKIKKKYSLPVPGSILFTILITCITCDFKKVYFSAETWKSIFVFVGILAFFSLVCLLISSFNVSINEDDFFNDLKKP